MKTNLTEMEQAIKERLERGFKNWNGGYDCWLEWCNILYDDESIYNVHGHKLTLKGYQEMMGKLFEIQDIKLGQFHNMLIEDDWCAIRYDVITVDKKTGEELLSESFEFVRFKNTPNGVKVDQGWATSTAPVVPK